MQVMPKFIILLHFKLTYPFSANGGYIDEHNIKPQKTQNSTEIHRINYYAL